MLDGKRFNAPIYLDNKTQVGKVEEVFGPINSVYFTIKMSDGVVATSYSDGDKLFIDPAKLLPMEIIKTTSKMDLLCMITTKKYQCCPGGARTSGRDHYYL